MGIRSKGIKYKQINLMDTAKVSTLAVPEGFKGDPAIKM